MNSKAGQLTLPFFTLCTILRFVIASAMEAELGALFLNYKEGMIFWLTLKELGHPQPKMQIHCNNMTAVGIANNTVKWQSLRSMEMQYFWICDKVAQGAYVIKWHPGQENLADYQSKHQVGAHHQAIWPWYLHKKNLPWYSRGLQSLALCKGVLELSHKGTYVTYPYLEYLYARRELRYIKYIRYLITRRNHTYFLRMILLIA